MACCRWGTWAPILLLPACDCGYRSGQDPTDASFDRNIAAGPDAGDAGDLDAGPADCPPVGLRAIESITVVEAECWTITTLGAEHGTTVAPSIAIGRDGTIHVAFLMSQDRRVELRHATNESGVWEFETIDCREDATSLLTGTTIAVDGAGVVYVASASPSRSGAQVLATGVGATWNFELLDFLASAPSFDFELGPGGEAYVLGGSVSGGGSLVLGARASGGHWGESLIALPAFAGRFADLEVADGTSFVVFEDSCPGDEEVLARCEADEFPNLRDIDLASSDGGAWVVRTITSDYHGNATIALAVDTDRAPHVAYFDSDARLVFGATDQDGWSWEVVDDGRFGPSAVCAMLIDDAGAVHASYAGADEDTGIFYSTNRTGAWVRERVADGQGSLSDPALALGPDGRIRTVWAEPEPNGSASRLAVGVRTCE